MRLFLIIMHVLRAAKYSLDNFKDMDVREDRCLGVGRPPDVVEEQSFSFTSRDDVLIDHSSRQILNFKIVVVVRLVIDLFQLMSVAPRERSGAPCQICMDEI